MNSYRETVKEKKITLSTLDETLNKLEDELRQLKQIITCLIVASSFFFLATFPILILLLQYLHFLEKFVLPPG